MNAKWTALGLLAAAVGVVQADDRKTHPKDQPHPVPLTRPALKQALEDLKHVKPWIPLPELTEEEAKKYGERGPTYEARLRHHYMGGSDMRGTPNRDPDPAATLTYAFKTQLFWIVSRTNNCHY